MTNQLQGEILYAGWDGGAGETGWAHTPWLSVRGDFATYGVQVLTISAVSLAWEVQTRTAEDPAVTTILTGTAIGAASTSTAINTTAAKQLVRYRFNTGAATSTTNFAIFRPLQPSWQLDR